ncbi:MAG: hypothetical protein AAGA97_05350, partial [Pseudomonadota bacterium]
MTPDIPNMRQNMSCVVVFATAMIRKGVPVAAGAGERDTVFCTVSNSGLKTSAWPMANAKKYSTGRIARSLNADPS